MRNSERKNVSPLDAHFLFVQGIHNVIGSKTWQLTVHHPGDFN
jgi:hypothetical protein